MVGTRFLCAVYLAFAFSVACSPTIGDSGVDAGNTGVSCGGGGDTRCSGASFQECQDGEWVGVENCSSACDALLGCVDCRPSAGYTCYGDAVHECNDDGTYGDKVLDCTDGPCVNGSCGDSISGDCAGGTDLIYVVDDAYRLLSFNPRDDAHTFELIGNLSCPAGPSFEPTLPQATPFSMSVDRSGTAWVLYNSGEVFHVDITDTSRCANSGFQVGQQGFELFGMGFVSNSPGSSDETLFIAGGDRTMQQPGTLASLDTSTLAVSRIGTLSVTEHGPELTGTGDAELYGYYPQSIAQSLVGRISKTTAQNEQQWQVGALQDQVRAWAFAHWGGRFYIFITTIDMFGLTTTSKVMRLDPSTGQVATVVQTDSTQTPHYIIVGAGVSTCAPVVID